MTEPELRDAICETGRRLWQHGLVGGAEGNISVRLDAGRLLCTPTGLSKGHLRPTDCVVIDLGGSALCDGQPSSEIKLHLAAYKARPDCVAVVHAHPAMATAFALAGIEVPDDLLPEAAYVLGPVATVPFGMPGTDDLPRAAAPLLQGHKTFLLANHGALALGTSLDDAFNRMDVLERVCQVVANARSIGTPKPLPGPAFAAIRDQWLHGRLG